jgi:flagellar hook-associated protein 1 FlgK
VSLPISVPTNILGSLHLARRALVAHQTTLDTIGHNLSNVNTPGYTRQRAELVSVVSRGGVDVQEVRRLRDRFLDASLLTEQQSLGRSLAQSDILERLQAVVNDQPGTGLSAMFDHLFQGFQDLAVSPTDVAARLTVVDRASQLAATFRRMTGRVDELEADLTGQIQQKVRDANSLLTQIADLHRQIIATNGGPVPNDLLDQRDRLVSDLTQIVGVTALDRTDGTVQLALTGSGVLLVDGTSVAPLSVTINTTADTVDVTPGTASVPVTPRNGALAALMDARNAPTGVVKQALTDLDTLARTLVTEVNRLHTQGAGLTGFTALTSANAVTSAAVPLTGAGLAFPPGGGSFQVIVHDASGAVASTVTVPVTAGVTTLDDVRAALDADPNLAATITGGRLTLTAAASTTFTFAADTAGALAALGLNTFFTGSDARTIAVDPTLAADATKVAAGLVDGAGLAHPGDGANALALARLRTGQVMSGGTATFTEFYGGIVSGIGSAARDAGEAVDRQQAATQLVAGLQQQAEGVSTDEELIALSQTQTAYAAAARFATTINDVIETLLEMGT